MNTEFEMCLLIWYIWVLCAGHISMSALAPNEAPTVGDLFEYPLLPLR